MRLAKPVNVLAASKRARLNDKNNSLQDKGTDAARNPEISDQKYQQITPDDTPQSSEDNFDSHENPSQLVSQDYKSLAQRQQNEHIASHIDQCKIPPPMHQVKSDTVPTADEPVSANRSSMISPTNKSPITANSKLWVRIPYPLSSFTSPAPFQNNQMAQQTGDMAHHSRTNVRGWFDLGATQMRQLTVDSVEDAGDATWKDSCPVKVKLPEE